MTAPRDEPTRPNKVSEVDRAYPHDVPKSNRSSYVIAIGFILAIIALSFTPEYAAVPDAFRAALVE